jgi:hypothetical protein
LPLFAFWASAHAGFLIGFFILALFVFTKVLELLSRKFSLSFVDYGKLLSAKQIVIFSAFSFLALLTTLATPYGFKLYEFLSGYSNSFYQGHIGEWQGQYFYPFVYPQLIFLEIVLIYLVFLFLAVFLFKGGRRQKFDLWPLFLAVIFLGLSFKARRHFPLLFIVSLPGMAYFLIDFFNLRFAFIKKIKIDSLLSRLLAVFIFAALTIGIAAVAVGVNFTATPEIAYQDKYPRAAIQFLRAHPEWNDLRIFNDYGWGGYLIWQYPERKLFIDGRLPQFKLGESTMLEEYFTFFDKEVLATKLQEHDIGLALLSVGSELPKVRWWEKVIFSVDEDKLVEAQENGLTLLNYLANSPDWQSAYKDGVAEIFIKK